MEWAPESGKREIRGKTPAAVAHELATVIGPLTFEERGVTLDDCEVWVRKSPRRGRFAYRVVKDGDAIKHGEDRGLERALEGAVRFVCLERQPC